MTVQIALSVLNNSNTFYSWLSIVTSLDNKIKNYTNNVVGLMGNFNSNTQDDIAYRNGTVVSSLLKESQIYNVLQTCNSFFLFHWYHYF